MASVTLYRDDQCTDVIASGFVGEYKTIYGHTPDITRSVSDITFPDDDTATTVWYLRFFYYSTINDKSESTELTLDVTEDASHYDYAYFTPDFRLRYKILKQDTHQYTAEFGRFEYLDNGAWTAIGTAGVGTVNNAYDPPTISLRTLKDGAKYREGIYPHYTDVTIDSENYLGVDVTYQPIGQPSKTTTRCLIAVSRVDKLFIQAEPKPYTPPDGRARRSGGGQGYYPNSDIPALPTVGINNAFDNVLGRGSGLTYYKLTGNSFVDITKFLYGGNLTKVFTGDTYRDAIASVIFIPLDVTTQVTNTLGLVYLANKSVSVSGGCNIVTRPLQELYFGSINLTAETFGYQNFADFTQTQAVLYLPCYGCVNLDMRYIAGGIIDLRGVVDVRNGNILYRLETRSSQDAKPVLYGQYTGNCGIPVPIGGANASPTILGAASSIGSVAVGLTSGNMLGAFSGLQSFVNGFAPSVDKSGALQPMCAGYGTPEPILQISMQIMVKPPKYDDLTGIPSGGTNDDGYQVSDYHGFFRAAQCHIDIPDATDRERAEIEALLKQGVILP